MVRESDRFSPLLSGGVPTLTAISSPADADAGGLAPVTVVDGGDCDIPQGAFHCLLVPDTFWRFYKIYPASAPMWPIRLTRGVPPMTC
ncbi:hypothetical protein ABC761_07105 [Salmonella sp. ZASA478]